MNAFEFEPHYNVIDDGEQVQIYESVMQNSDNNVTYTLLRAASYIKDNRLLPEGFDKLSVSGDIAVYGAALADADFTGGGDGITYLVPTTGNDGPLEVRLALLYQTAGYQFLNDLLRDDTAEVNRFSAYLDEACKLPEVISSTVYSIP